MQIGFNNDVDWEGVRFHIQTEDLGLSSGKITSQVFRGGAIVDTISVSYSEHIEDLDDPDQRDQEIRKRMRTLHKLCFRHIKSNKYTPEGQTQGDADAAAKVDVGPTTETPAVDRLEDEERTEIDGFSVAGEQEELGEKVDEKSRGEPVELADVETTPEDEEEPGPSPTNGDEPKADQAPTRVAAFRGLDFVEDRTLPELLNELIPQ